MAIFSAVHVYRHRIDRWRPTEKNTNSATSVLNEQRYLIQRSDTHTRFINKKYNAVLAGENLQIMSDIQLL